MEARYVKMMGTGLVVPQQKITSAQLDERLGCSAGWVERKSGVRTRYFASEETASQMGAQAVRAAVTAAGIELDDVDCIVCTNAIAEQPIPATAVLIHRELGMRSIPAFDINATCMGFLVGLDLLAQMVAMHRYRYVVLVSSEIGSPGLNWGQRESCILFGDGAAAVVLGASEQTSFRTTSKVVATHFETYSEGARLSEIRGGGSRYPSVELPNRKREDYLFDMDGKGIFKLVARKLPAFMDRLLSLASTSMQQIDKVIPHQGSQMAMTLLRQKLGIPQEKFVNIIADYGNTISASIPMSLHTAIARGEIVRGQRIALLGLAAGVSMGGVILDY